MFHKNLASSSDRNRDYGTPGILPGTPAMTPSGATPGLTSSVMSPAPVTPSYTGPSTTSVMTPRDPSGFLSSMDGVGEVGEPHQDEEPEEENREGPAEEDIIRQLTMANPFTPSNQAAFSRVSSWVDSSYPSAVSGTPQTAVSRQETVETLPTTGVPEATGWASEMALLQQKYGATKPVIHNVVATANLGCELDLKQIAMTARNAEFNPRRFAAVIMRIREPKSTALVFKSGKLVVTGTKCQEDARHAARKFGRVIMKVGYESARFTDFRVENLVSTFNVPFPIHLERLYRSLPNAMHSQVSLPLSYT